MLRIQKLGRLLTQTDARDVHAQVSGALEAQRDARREQFIAQLVTRVNTASDLRDRVAEHASRKIFGRTQRPFIHFNAKRITEVQPEVMLGQHGTPRLPIQVMPLFLVSDFLYNHILAKYGAQGKERNGRAIQQQEDNKGNHLTLLEGIKKIHLNPRYPEWARVTGQEVPSALFANGFPKTYEVQGGQLGLLPESPEKLWVAYGKLSETGTALGASQALPLEAQDEATFRAMQRTRDTLLERLSLTYTTTDVKGSPLTYENWWERLTASYSTEELGQLSELLSQTRQLVDTGLPLDVKPFFRQLCQTAVECFEFDRQLGMPKYPEVQALSIAQRLAYANQITHKHVSIEGVSAAQPPTPQRVLETLRASNFSPAASLCAALEQHADQLRLSVHGVSGPRIAKALQVYSEASGPLKDILRHSSAQFQAMGLTETWRSALDMLPDGGKAFNRSLQETLNALNERPLSRAGVEVVPQWEGLLVAGQSSWKSTPRAKKLWQTAEQLISTYFPTLNGALRRVKEVVSGPSV